MHLLMLEPFPIYLGYAGLLFSGLKLILPDPNTIKVEHRTSRVQKNSNISFNCNNLWGYNFKSWIFFNDFFIFN